MRTSLLADLAQRTDGLRDEGLFKSERVIASPQTAHITLSDGSEVLNLCANNYLGLADHPDAGAGGAARRSTQHGFGMASVRFICGTQDVHKELEAALSRLPRHRGHDPLLLLLRRQRRAVRDAARRGGRGHLRRAQPRLDHRRHPPVQGEAAAATPTTTWPSWRQLLRDAADARYRLIATDGVFSMDGIIANLRGHLRPRRPVRRDGHGGRLPRGRLHRRGRPRHARALRRDGPRGHHHRHPRQGAGRRLAAATPAARQEIVDWLRQRSRPYLFSNSLAPAIAATTAQRPRPARARRRPAAAAASQREQFRAGMTKPPASRSPARATRSSR